MINPYAIAGALLLWALTLAGVGFWQYGNGVQIERGKWAIQTAKNNAEYSAQVYAMEEKARADENLRKLELANIAEAREKERVNYEAQKSADTANALRGTLRLRIPTAECAPRGGQLPETGTAAGVGHDSQGSELPRQITADLYALANEADDIARQLGACQKVLIGERN